MAALAPFRVALIAPTSTPPVGQIASTESPDVAALIGAVTYAGVLTSTESADVMAAAGSVSLAGAITSTESADVMAAAGVGRLVVVGTAQWASRKLVRVFSSRGLSR